MLENKLFVKAEKCEFRVPSVSFLGFIIEVGQVKSDPAKVQAVSGLHPPLANNSSYSWIYQPLLAFQSRLQQSGSPPNLTHLQYFPLCLVT